MSESNASNQLCWRIIVSGRVQGVYFRAFTRKQAEKLGLTGHAKNLPDGNVEIIACGPKPALQQLLAWAHKGPLLANVSQVDVLPYQPEKPFSGFTVC
jgi:acylphosphatase